MVKGCLWAAGVLALLIFGLVVYVGNSPSLQRGSTAYASWSILHASEAYFEAKGKHPKSLHEALDIYRRKEPEYAAKAEEFIQRYDPIVMFRWGNNKEEVEMWIKPTQNCASGWISVSDGNNISPNQHPPHDAVYLYVPGSPKP